MMMAFMVLGYILTATGKLHEDASKTLSTVLVYVCMPAMTISSFAKNMTIENLAQQSTMILCGAITIVGGYLIAVILAKFFSNDVFLRGIYAYSFAVPNIGYMGYPMMAAVFGDKMLFNMLMFCIPFNIFIYSKGIKLLCPNARGGAKAILTQPAMVGMMIGTVIGLFGIKLPSIIVNILQPASDCMAPIAMLMTGCVIAQKPIRELVGDIKAYEASILRLVVIPVVVVVLLALLKVDSTIIIVTGVTLLMPLGLNSVVFPEAFGGDGRPGAKLALVSHVMGLITIPLMFGILTFIIK